MKKNETMTLRVIIDDPEKAEWILKAWPNAVNGLRVGGIAYGDMMQERDEFRQAASFYIREEDETTDEAVKAHCGNSFSTPDEAAAAAPDNVTPGGAWDVVDARGNVYRSSQGDPT